MFEAGLLAGKRVLITGGGSGLGASMALRFAELGAALVLTGRRENLLSETAERIRSSTGARVDTHRCDVRDPAMVAATIAAAWNEAPIDVLVNNAAATFIAQTERLSANAADAILGATLHGALYNTLEVGRRWIDERRRGVVLSILSTSTITGRAFTVPSAIAKSGVLAMTRSLAVEWGPRGIRTVAIAPGPFPTPGAWQRLHPQARQAADDTPRAHATSADPGSPAPVGPGARVPLGRVGEHIELANLASYLISDQAGYINGEMVTIDGGQHLRTSGAEDLLAWSDDDWRLLRESSRPARGGMSPAATPAAPSSGPLDSAGQT